MSTHTTKHLTLLAKSKRSQSALEYMMTYGWAILIIVIVAVILYSMGIFNPSSSVTFTSSGFSPFTVSSSLCNNLGYKIAVIAGPIPNNANSLTISKVFLTSATGANATTSSYTLTNPVTLKSGQSATILIPTVACNVANVHYSMSANIEYSYTVPTIGLQTINTTGTVAGTSIAGKPSVLTSYEPLTITNTQNTATPSPFQQMVNFTSSDPGWTSISTSNFGQNVEFFYYNGTVIPSWLESYSSSNAIWWLKIAAIPAGSSETVYVGFAPITTNLFNNVNDGEAPQLSSTYAEYDDGVNVFNYYSRFGGSSLPSGWNDFGSDYSLTYGTTYLTITTTDSGGTYGGIYTSTQVPTIPSIYEFYGNIYTSGDYNFVGVLDTSLPSSNPYSNSAYVIQVGSRPDWDIVGGDNGYYYDTGYSDQDLTQVYGLSIPSSTSAQFFYNYTSTPETTGMISETPSSFVFTGSGGSPLYIYWYRVRAYPPNGVMPTVNFGSVA